MGRPARQSFYPGSFVPVDQFFDAARIHSGIDNDLFYTENPVGVFWEELVTANLPDPYKIKKSLEIKPDDDELVKQLKRSLQSEVEWYAMGDNNGLEDNEREWQKAQLVEPAKLVITRAAFDLLKHEDDGKIRILEELKKRAIRVEWVAPQGNNTRSVFPDTVAWYFDPRVYLAIIKEYPWLLDRDLGVKAGPMNYQPSYARGKHWTP